ncbi:N-6 adenine-specific DNA methylase [Vibrio phage 1.232.O._10N.261.51.E11]|nr:N-6 adenine-specific DNA methylase [Vibrio phage 1.232.O._10N.261.51.E11]
MSDQSEQLLNLSFLGEEGQETTQSPGQESGDLLDVSFLGSPQQPMIEEDWGSVLSKTMDNLPERAQLGVNAIIQDMRYQYSQAVDATNDASKITRRLNANPQDEEARQVAEGLGVNPDSLIGDPRATTDAFKQLSESIRSEKIQNDPEIARLVSEANVLQEELRANAPQVDQWSAKGIVSNMLGAGAEMLPSVLATLVTKKPVIGSGIMAGQVYGQKLAEGQEKGLTREQGRDRAVIATLTEFATERIPLGQLIKPGSNFIEGTAKTALSEGVQETVTEAVNLGYDAGVLKEEMTLEEALEAMAYSGLIGAGVGGAFGAATTPFRGDAVPPEALPEESLDRMVAQTQGIEAAQPEADALDSAMQTTQQQSAQASVVQAKQRRAQKDQEPLPDYLEKIRFKTTGYPGEVQGLSTVEQTLAEADTGLSALDEELAKSESFFASLQESEEAAPTTPERREKLYEGLERQRITGGIGEVQQRLSRPTAPDVAELIRRAPEETGPTPGELEFRRLNDREFLEEQKDKAIPPSLQKTETGKRLLNRGYRSALEGYKELTDKTKTSTKLNPSVDTISEAAAKLGGLDRKQAGSEGFDEASFKRNKLFPATGGRSFDEMAEVLNEQGYTNRENERLSANDIVDMVGGEVDQGESHYSNQVLAEMLTEDAAAVKEWSRELGGPERLNTAITKALAGEKLGAKQTQVVDEILTTVEAIRAEEVPGAVETLTARREERRAKEVETFNELVQEETGTEQAVADFDQYSEVMAELPEDADVYDAAFVSVATQASEKNFEATDSVLERLESGEINTDQALTELNQINEVTVDEQTTQEPEAERPETIEPVDTKPVEETKPERTAEEIKADTLRLKSTPEGMEEFVTPWESLTDAEKELWKTSAKTQKVIEPKQEKAEEIQEPTPEAEPETTEAVITEELEEPEASEEYTFNFGKHKGKTLSEVADEAPEYIEWIKGKKGFKKSKPDLIEAITQLEGTQDAPSTVRDLEPDPAANQPIDTLDQNLSAEQERGRAREVSEQVTEDLENSRAKQQDPSGVSIDSPLDVGTESIETVDQQDGQRVDEIGVTGDNDSRGNTKPSDERLPTEPNGIEKVLEEAKQRQQSTRSDQQLEADKIDVVVGDAQNIADTLPLLSPEQVSDVISAERRLYEQFKKGMLFTNGTGTGKTYTGAGIIKRALRQGKKVLVVAPNGTIGGWQGAAKDLGFELKKLPNKSTGAGDNQATITTFQNFADNQELMQEHFDLVVYDESHKLMANMQGSDTKATAAHFALTNREGKSRGAMAYAKEFAKLRDDIRKHAKDNDVSEAEATQLPKFQRRRNALLKKSDAVDRKAQKAEKKSPTKAVFLSATPFSGHKSVFYGDGYIFESDEGYKDKGGYNSGNPQQQFLVKNFGYRMKYNKANTPAADVDVGLLERDWADQMFDSGAMVGRVLNLPHDYSREFVVVEPGVGSKVDELYEYVNYKDYPELSSLLQQWRKNGMDRQLAEALRIRGSLERIQKHLDIGRKVVVFHQRMNINIEQPLPPTSADPKIGPELKKLKKARPDLFNIGFSDLHAAPKQIVDEFGRDRVALFNGENTKERNKELKEFNTDGGKKDIIVISKDAGKEGLSAHDISAVNQRALIITNTPQSPADAIQMEGRIYRFGLASNAVIEYPSVQTSFEKIAFRDVVSRRTATAENLAMGSQARLLRESFREGYMEPRITLPDYTQGTGGKDSDRNTNEVTEFDRAKTYYWKRAQKTQATKAEEGADYFATPEPVGLSMVSLSGLVPGEKAMEPSAGHGAIGRWLPETTTNVFVEQSPQLIGELALVSEGEVKNMDFEDLNVINKFDVVVMNPPFGRGGATAIQHIDKATKHLNDGGRVVAIYPEGPAADKAFDKWYEGVEGIYQVGEIKLPDVTFSRAGTKVMTRIVILDKDVKGGNVYKGELNRDYSKVTDANELFERMEQLESIPRPDVSISASEVGLSLEEENGKYIATLSEFRTSGPARRLGKRELKKLADKYFGEVQTDTRSYWDENKYVFDNQKERNSFLKAILEESQPKKSQLASLVKDNEISKVELDSRVDKLKSEIAEIDGVKTISLYMSNRGVLKLNTIIIDKEKRKSGVGTDVLNRITSFADKHGVQTTLSPAIQDDFQGTTSRTRLIKFYKRFGFVENKGRNKDFAISDAMYRDPKGGVTRLASIATGRTRGIPAADVQKEIDSFVKEYKGVSPVTIAIADKQENLPVNLKEGEKVKALYNPGDVSLVMVAENFNSAKEVRETLQHELVVHYGLRALMGRDRYNMHMDRLLRSKDKKLVAAMDEIKADYAGYIDTDSKSGQRIIAEEALAKISETDLQVGALRRFTNAILRALKNVGIIADTATYTDAVNLIQSNARGLKGRVIQKGEVRTEEVETTFDQTPYLASLYNEQTIDNAPVSDGLKEQMKAVHYTGDNRSIATRIKDALTFDMTAARQGLLDQFESIKSYEIEKFGKVLSAEDSAYKQATLSTDTNAIVETALKHGIPQYNDGEVSIRDDVKPLQAVFDQVTSLGDDFLPVWTHWLAAKRVKDLNLIAQGKEKLFTQEMVNEIFAEVDSKPEVKAVFEQAQRDYAAFNKATLDFAQNAGLIDPAQRQMWEHDSYVPFYRMAEDAKKSGTFGKRGIEGQTAGIRQLKGGTDKLNIIESMVQNPMHLISASFKNIAMQKVVELTEGMAMDKVPMNWKPIDIDNRQIAKAMEELGIDFEALTTEQKEQYSTFFKMNAPQGENIVSVMVEGKREFYDVTDPLLLDSITALGPQPVNELVKLIGIPKRLLTNMVTSTPPFMIRNFIRDTMSNYVQADKVTGTTTQDTLLDATLMRPFGRAIKGMNASIKNDQDRFKIMALGGMSGEYFGSTTEDVAGTLIKPSKSGMKKAATNLFDGYKHVIRASEEANRIAVYRQVKENGGSDFEAAYQAKNVLNFSRSGQYKVVQFLIGTVPFLNARVQGLDRLYQGAKANPASFVLRGTLLTAATFALMAMNDDREEYWALNEHERDTYWHAWVDGVHIRIPKPFEVGAIFGTIPERVYEAATREEKVFLDRMGNMFMNTFSMNPVPQAFSPIVEQVANRSFFMDRPIVSMSLENLQPEMQFTNRTSEVAKMFANVMPDFMPDWARSPVRIEHLLNSYFGTVGGYVLGAGDNIAKTMGDTPIMPAKRVTDYPLVRDFIREGERSTKYVGRFYDMVNEASKLNRSVKDLEAQGRTDEAREMKAEYGSILQVRRRLNRARKRLTDINASIKRIYINRTMSAEAKRKKLDQLTKKKNDITKEISDKYWKLF